MGTITKKLGKKKNQNHTLAPEKQSALSINQRINTLKICAGHFHQEECLKIQISSQIIQSAQDQSNDKAKYEGL